MSPSFSMQAIRTSSTPPMPFARSATVGECDCQDGRSLSTEGARTGARALEECEPLNEVVVGHQLPPEAFFDDFAVLDHLQGIRGDDLADPPAPVLPDRDEHREAEKRRGADQPGEKRDVACGEGLRYALGYDEQGDEVDHGRPEDEFRERRQEGEEVRRGGREVFGEG